MEFLQWIIAISTAIIAVVFLILGVFLIKAFITLKKDIRLLSDGVEKKVQVLDVLWRSLLGFTAPEKKEIVNEPPRKLPVILRGLIFATVLWKTIQKRR